ncbi:MAG: RimK family alpha-L-glutamate ligase [Gemmataceae bacterium]|nr:RimK family alpha-L-glutamate ligase [Gemmataceae bacterium]
MHWAIFSAGTGWHVRDLERAARALGHETTALDFRQVRDTLPALAADYDRFDGFFVRTMPAGSLEQVVFRMDVLHRLEAKGKRVLNPPRALEICIDKYLACVRLEQAGLPVPPTVVCQSADQAMEAFAALGGDVVVKPLFGSEGRGLVRVSDPETAWRVLHAVERTQAMLYVQQYVRHPGWDLRAFVLGDRIIAAMRRQARADWRTNVAQGGKTTAVALTHEEESLALAAAVSVGAPIAGVDLLPRPEGGYFVLEVNAVPGWRALRKTTGVDVAAEVLSWAAESES